MYDNDFTLVAQNQLYLQSVQSYTVCVHSKKLYVGFN